MRLLFVTALFLLTAPLLASGLEDFLGDWKTEDGDTVEIYKCGDDTYCGKITALVEPNYEDGDEMAGKPKVDRENPDESKRTTPIMGLVFMKDFTFKKGILADGTIYDPNNGKTYKCKISLNKNGKLKVRGYIGVSLIGRTAVWSR